MLVIGLTGGFGCGKSTIRKLLDKFDDVGVYDCDESAKRIMTSKKFQPAAEGILGSDCFPDGQMDPKLVAKKFFLDPDLRKKLEATLFPLVRQDISVSLDICILKGKHFFVIETAILFDTGLDKMCDTTVCAICEDTVRRERLKANRGYTDDEITERLKHQMTDGELIRRADTTVSTDCRMDDLEARVDAFHDHLKKLYEIAERNRL